MSLILWKEQSWLDRLTLAIPESGKAIIIKTEENLKIEVHLNHTILGPYALGCFGTYSSIPLAEANRKQLAFAKYLQ